MTSASVLLNKVDLLFVISDVWTCSLIHEMSLTNIDSSNVHECVALKPSLTKLMLSFALTCMKKFYSHIYK